MLIYGYSIRIWFEQLCLYISDNIQCLLIPESPTGNIGGHSCSIALHAYIIWPKVCQNKVFIFANSLILDPQACNEVREGLFSLWREITSPCGPPMG